MEMQIMGQICREYFSNNDYFSCDDFQKVTSPVAAVATITLYLIEGLGIYAIREHFIKITKGSTKEYFA